MLWLRVENPPVEMAENPWQMLSNSVIGPNHRRVMSRMVSRVYSAHSTLAVRAMRAPSLSCVMPVASA